MAQSNWPVLAKTLHSLLGIYRRKELNIHKKIQKVEEKISTLKNEISIQEHEQQKLYSEIDQCIIGINQAASVEAITINKQNISYYKNKINVILSKKHKLQTEIDEQNNNLESTKIDKINICRKIYKYELIYEDQETASRAEEY